MCGAVSASLSYPRKAEKQVTQVRHLYLALELNHFEQLLSAYFYGKKSTTILEEKRELFIPESKFVYIHGIICMWFDFCF